MKIRPTLLFIILSLVAIASKAQMQATKTTKAGTTFGLRAGVNFQNLNGKNALGNKLENKLKAGFHIGANAEIPIAPDFYVQPGVLFSMKGAKIAKSDDKFNLSYVEVPVNLIYKPVLESGKLLLGFGPYIGFAVGGKINLNAGKDVDVQFQNTVSAAELSRGGYFVKRLDGGANFLAGYEFSSKLSFQLNAQLGLVNISPDYESISNDKSTTKNTGFGLSIGYRF